MDTTTAQQIAQEAMEQAIEQALDQAGFFYQAYLWMTGFDFNELFFMAMPTL